MIMTVKVSDTKIPLSKSSRYATTIDSKKTTQSHRRALIILKRFDHQFRKHNDNMQLR